MRNRVLLCAAIFTATLAVYLPALRGGLIWNDLDYLTKPELRDLAGLGRIWTWAPAAWIAGSGAGTGATQQYYPLLHSFFWVQHKLWGDSALGYHVVNVLLHATAACLLAFVVLRLLAPEDPKAGGSEDRKTGAPILRPSDPLGAQRATAWLAAALFALHPVMVESAAWISEQKNTLSTVFYLGAALVYLRWDAQRSADRPQPTAYWGATFLFVCALLSKSVTASLPAALLVALWWKHGKLGKRDVMPLLPWFAAGAAVGLFTGWVERDFIGAQGAEFGLSLLERGLLAGHVIWFYLGQLVWPAELIFIYPRWTVSTSDWGQWLYPTAAIGLLVALFAIRHRTRAPLAAYLFFVGTLFPTLGFFNVYAFRFSYVADHWEYLPAVGCFVLVAGGLVRLAGRKSRGSEDPRVRGSENRSSAPLTLRTPVLTASAVLLTALGAFSWRQAHLYDNLEGFYRTTLAQNPGAWMARNNLGLMLAQAGKFPEAIEHFTEAVRVKPDYADAESNLGAAFLELRRPDAAIVHLENAVRLTPTLVKARVNLGLALRAIGREPEAIAQFEEVVRLQPLAAEVFCELGFAYARAGNGPKAIAAFQGALRARPGFTAAIQGLADELRKAAEAQRLQNRQP